MVSLAAQGDSRKIREVKGSGKPKKSWSADIIPQAEHENHAGLQTSLDIGKTTLLGEVIGLAKGSVLGWAVSRGDRVACEAGDVGGLRSAYEYAVLDVVAHDVVQVAGSVSQELSHHCDHLIGVDSQTGAKEVRGTVAVGVPVAAVRVTVASVAVCRVSAAAGGTIAHVLSLGAARVEGKGVGNLVCLPDIDFIAAAAELADARILVIGGGFPAIDVALENELEL